MWFMLSPLAPLRRAEVVAAGLAGLLFVALWVAVVTGAGGAGGGAGRGSVRDPPQKPRVRAASPRIDLSGSRP